MSDKPIIKTGPGCLSSVIREAEAVLVSLNRYFIDDLPSDYKFFLGRWLTIKISARHYRKATSQDVLLDLDTHVEFRSSITNRRVAVPRKLPDEILRRARYQSEDTPFPQVHS
jgi:hypothetical protein